MKKVPHITSVIFKVIGYIFIIIGCLGGFTNLIVGNPPFLYWFLGLSFYLGLGFLFLALSKFLKRKS